MSNFQKLVRMTQRRAWLRRKRWFICVKRSDLHEVWTLGWHDSVSMQTVDNVNGEVGNDASVRTTENGGGG